MSVSEWKSMLELVPQFQTIRVVATGRLPMDQYGRPAQATATLGHLPVAVNDGRRDARSRRTRELPRLPGAGASSRHDDRGGPNRSPIRGSLSKAWTQPLGAPTPPHRRAMLLSRMPGRTKVDQRIINLYDRFTHGGMNRREFLDRLAELAGSVAAAAALLPLLQNDYARAAIVAVDDGRLAAERVSYDSPKGKINGYLVRGKARGKP